MDVLPGPWGERVEGVEGDGAEKSKCILEEFIDARLPSPVRMLPHGRIYRSNNLLSMSVLSVIQVEIGEGSFSPIDVLSDIGTSWSRADFVAGIGRGGPTRSSVLDVFVW